MLKFLVPGILLAAGSATAPAAAQTPAPAESYSAKLERLPELERYAALRTALVSSGEVCRRVELARRSGTMRNLAMWSVRCAPSGEYGMFIGPDGSVQARTCSDLVKLKLPPCALPPRAPTAARAAPPARR